MASHRVMRRTASRAEVDQRQNGGKTFSEEMRQLRWCKSNNNNKDHWGRTVFCFQVRVRVSWKETQSLGSQSRWMLRKSSVMPHIWSNKMNTHWSFLDMQSPSYQIFYQNYNGSEAHRGHRGWSGQRGRGRGHTDFSRGQGRGFKRKGPGVQVSVVHISFPDWWVSASINHHNSHGIQGPCVKATKWSLQTHTPFSFLLWHQKSFRQNFTVVSCVVSETLVPECLILNVSIDFADRLLRWKKRRKRRSCRFSARRVTRGSRPAWSSGSM